MTVNINEHKVVYLLPDGTFKNTTSYSARAAFHFCKRYFYLTRVRGWRKKLDGVAMDLGKIAEAAVVHQIRFREGGVEQFEKLWKQVRETKDFDKKQYTKVEESWENCLRIGREWLTIFAINQDRYPFQRAQFQVPLSKKIFPKTSYDSIKNLSYLDIYSEPPPNHPSLVPVTQFTGKVRPLITDVKTASKELESGLIALDPQLVEYAWMYNVPDVAFLWFVKKSHGFKHASRVTLLTTHNPFPAGAEVIVLDKDGADRVWVSTKDDVENYARACCAPDGSSLRGKALDMAAQTYIIGSSAVSVPVSDVSKQRVQFATALLTPEAIQDMGKVVGQTTIEMVVAHEQDFYPMEPGLRYPSDKCPTCDMRFICAGDTAGRDLNLTRSGEEWLDSTLEE